MLVESVSSSRSAEQQQANYLCRCVTCLLVPFSDVILVTTYTLFHLGDLVL